MANHFCKYFVFVCLFVCEIADNCYAKRYIRIEIYIYTLGRTLKECRISSTSLLVCRFDTQLSLEMLNKKLYSQYMGQLEYTASH